VRVPAFAKINLSPRIVGTRPDGYHELRTIFQSIALHDVLTIRRASGPLRLTCDDDHVPVDGANLIVRAADAAWRAAGWRGKPRDVSVHLTKRIPLEAGLGGGSSDAAAALRAFGRMWRIDPRELKAIASAIGADVPYFLEGGTVLGLDRGDALFPLIDHRPAWVVLALPAFGVSTREAYGWFDADRHRRIPERRQPGRENDLQAPVVRRRPEISRIVTALQHAGADHAAMSGSGSAVFGLFSSRTAARAAAASVARRLSRPALLTRTLSGAAYWKRAGLARK